MCSTVIVATVSPLAKDSAHSASTLSYAAPLRVAIKAAPSNLELDRRDPALWNHDQAAEWITKVTDGNLDPSVLLEATLTGRELCTMPEPEIFRRMVVSLGEERGTRMAGMLYQTLWTAIIDAKTRGRKPDGSIITEEMEAQEQKEAEERNAAKIALWKGREAQLQSELSFGEDGLSTDQAGSRFTDQ